MKRSTVVVFFDCESDARPTRDERGDADFTDTECTCVCALVVSFHDEFITQHVRNKYGHDDGATDRLLRMGRKVTCWRDVLPSATCKTPFEPLFEEFDKADLIVGYNVFEFDFPLLKKYYQRNERRYRYMRHRLKCHDAFTRLRDATGMWPSLNSLLTLNGLASKSGDGGNAIVLWEQNRRAELESYCETDVLRTAQLCMLPSLRMPNVLVSIPQHIYSAVTVVEQIAYTRLLQHGLLQHKDAQGNDEDCAATPTTNDNETWELVN